MNIDKADCLELDRNDPLASYRQRFHLPDEMIYLDGNSLGALPKSAPSVFQDVVDREWGKDLITSWNRAGWFEMPSELGNRLGRFLGTADGQVVVCDTTSVNLYKAIRAALQLNSDRHELVTEVDTFPTDLYIMGGAISGGDRSITIKRSESMDGIIELITDQTAVVVLSQINYKTGELLPMAEITRAAHEAGALVIWDVCHTAGIMPIELDRLEVDFAVGCTYKYLNGGPGSPAFIYVAERHISNCTQPLSGWWGHRAPFDFSGDYEPDPGIKRFLCGTQPILSMKGVACGLDSYEEISLEAIREKSKQLTSLFIDLVQQRCDGWGLKLVTPENPEQRGSHVSFAFEHGYAVIQALIARGVIGDFRAPDIMRFGFAPLYIGYEDIWNAVSILQQCLEQQVWNQTEFNQRRSVT